MLSCLQHGGGRRRGKGLAKGTRDPSGPLLPDAAAWDSSLPPVLKGRGGCLSALRGREMGMEKVQCWEGAALCLFPGEGGECPGGFNPETRSLTSWLVCL